MSNAVNSIPLQILLLKFFYMMSIRSHFGHSSPKGNIVFNQCPLNSIKNNISIDKNVQNQMTSIVKVKYVLLEIYEYSLLVFAKVNEET